MGLTSRNYYQKPKLDFHTSWDDGNKLDLKIADILERTGHVQNSTFYVVLDWIGTEGFMTWDDIKDLDKRGFQIGSHTISHPMDLKQLHDDFLFAEVQSSKEMIESVLGHKIRSFCYPRGRMDNRVRHYVEEAGYLNARVTGKPGVRDASDPYKLPGTLHVFPREEYGGEHWAKFGKGVVQASRDNDYFNLWGHSPEVEKYDQWNDLEEFLKYVKSH